MAEKISMARARVASEPPHMARYSGSVYFCLPCGDTARLQPRPRPGHRGDAPHSPGPGTVPPAPPCPERGTEHTATGQAGEYCRGQPLALQHLERGEQLDLEKKRTLRSSQSATRPNAESCTWVRTGWMEGWRAALQRGFGWQIGCDLAMCSPSLESKLCSRLIPSSMGSR